MEKTKTKMDKCEKRQKMQQWKKKKEARKCKVRRVDFNVTLYLSHGVSSLRDLAYHTEKPFSHLA